MSFRDLFLIVITCVNRNDRFPSRTHFRKSNYLPLFLLTT